MKKLMFLLLSLVSFSVYAEYISIENTDFVRAGSSHNFKVIYYSDNGNVDVTSQARFGYVSNTSSQIGGQFVFSPSTSGYDYSTLISATYTTPAGELLSDTATVNVSSRPNYISIQGPMMVHMGSSASFRAIAYFDQRSYDVTNAGRWWCFSGSINSGFYMAPRNAMSSSDTVYFQYGMTTDTQFVSIMK